MVKITGDKAFSAKLKGLTSPQAKRQLGAALYRGGDILATEAFISIKAGSVSGKNHVPSAPGSPPNNDTSVLADSIQTLQFKEGNGSITVEVIADAPYAAAQEFGTSKLPERPFMRPALAKTKDQIMGEITKAVDRLIAGGSIR